MVKPTLDIDDLGKFNNDTFIMDNDFNYTGSLDNITSTKNTNGLILFLKEKNEFSGLLPKLEEKYNFLDLNAKDGFVNPNIFQDLILDIMDYAKIKNHNFAKFLGKFSSRKQVYGFHVDLVRKIIDFPSAMEIVTNFNRDMNNAFIMQFAGNKFEKNLMVTNYVHKYAENERNLISILNEPWCEGIWEDIGTLMNVTDADNISKAKIKYTWFGVKELANFYNDFSFDIQERQTNIDGTQYFEKRILLKEKEFNFQRSLVAKMLASKPPKTVKNSKKYNQEELNVLFENLSGKPITSRKIYSDKTYSIESFSRSELDELISKNQASYVDVAIKPLTDSYGIIFEEGDIFGAPYSFTQVINPRENRGNTFKKLASLPVNLIKSGQYARQMADIAQQKVYQANIEKERAIKNEKIAISERKRAESARNEAIISKNEAIKAKENEAAARKSEYIALEKIINKEKEIVKIISTMAGRVAHEVRNALTGGKLQTSSFKNYPLFEDEKLKEFHDRNLFESYRNVMYKLMNNFDAYITENKIDLDNAQNDFIIYLKEIHKIMGYLEPAMDIIEDGIEGGLELTNRFRNFANEQDIERGNDPIDILDLISSYENKYSYSLSKKGINYYVNTNMTECKILGERMQINSILENIISNAFNAVEDSDEKNITVHINEVLSNNETYIKVDVQDSGIGIEKDKIEDIFIPFNSTNPEPGHGLGLSEVYNWVKKYDGKIDVESELGTGSKFTVYLKK